MSISDSDENAASAALTALARDLVSEISDAKAAEIAELAAGLPDGRVIVRGDSFGTFVPPAPKWNPWSHTIAGGADRSHLLSGQQRPHYYGGPLLTEDAETPQDGSQEPPGGQPARREIPPTGLAPGQEEALHGGRGVDVPLQQPEHPDGLPSRPARQQARRRSRRTRWR